MLLKSFAAALVALTIPVSAMTGAAVAQTKLTKMIVAFPPGGPVDIVARIIAEPMAKALGGTVVVENRSGGNTLIAAQSVAGSPADGSVVFLSSMSTMVLNPLLYEKLPYDPDKDFVPISMVISNPPVLVVHPSNTAKDGAEFAAAAKAASQPIPIGSAGIGGTTHISIELFTQATGAPLLHVPYKGAAPVITDLLGNHVQGFFGDLPGVISYIRAGKLKPLGLLAKNEHPLLPGIKTMDSLGIKGTESENWYSLYAPAKTPPDVIARLHAAVVATLKDEAIRSKLVDIGCVIVGSTPEELDMVRKENTDRMRTIIKARGIKLE